MAINKVVGLIPARYESSRLSHKLLLEIRGKSVLQRVFEQCLKSQLLHRIIIVTDHQVIEEHARSFGAEVIRSKNEFISGTDRIAECAEVLEEFNYVVNIQGDEPFIDPENIDKLISLVLNSNCEIASLGMMITDSSERQNKNIVKLVTNLQDEAMYFSRSEIPYKRDLTEINFQVWKRHLGIYAFKRSALLQITKLKPSLLEVTEKLEQLRWLENGYKIKIALVDNHATGIDTETDLLEAREYAELHKL